MALTTRCLGCGTRTKGSRCATCQARRDRARGTTSERGYGTAHQRRARAVIAAQPWCSDCGSTLDLTADHITPLARGGHPLGPLRVLCRSCNSRSANRSR
jgi:5-methylcytosine-specific restriction enzyme A